MQNTQEIWKDISGLEGRYQISDLGRVKSLSRVVDNGYRKRTVRERILIPILTYEYFRVNIIQDGKKKSPKIHKLVAQMFLGHTPCGMKQVVDHINGIKTDNRVVNLRLVNMRENSSNRTTKVSSKYVGVSWSKKQQKWRSRIYIDGKHIRLGEFKNEMEAAIAYQNKLKTITS